MLRLGDKTRWGRVAAVLGIMYDAETQAKGERYYLMAQDATETLAGTVALVPAIVVEQVSKELANGR